MEDKTTNYNFNKPNPIANPNDPFDLKKFISDNLDLIDKLFKKKADLIGGKLPTSQLTLDNTPTEGSNNPISSGGAKTALDKKQNAEDAFSGDYNDLQNIPKSFKPSEHTHSFNSLDDKPKSYPPSEHTHTFSSIRERPESYPPSEHRHIALEVLKGTIPPTTSTVGVVGQFYLDTADKKLYQCVEIIDSTYTWKFVETLQVGDIIQSSRNMSDSWKLCNGVTYAYSRYPQLHALDELEEDTASWQLKHPRVIGNKTPPTTSLKIANLDGKVFVYGHNSDNEAFLGELTSQDDELDLHYIGVGATANSMTHGNGYYGIAIASNTAVGYLYCADTKDIYDSNNWHKTLKSMSNFHNGNPTSYTGCSVLFVNGYFALSVEMAVGGDRSGAVLYTTDVTNISVCSECTTSTYYSSNSSGYGLFFVYMNGHYITGSNYNTSNTGLVWGDTINSITTKYIISGVDTLYQISTNGTVLGITAKNSTNSYLYLSLDGSIGFRTIGLPAYGYCYGFHIASKKMYVGMYLQSGACIRVYESNISVSPTWVLHKVYSAPSIAAYDWAFGDNVWGAIIYSKELSSSRLVLVQNTADLFPLGKTLPTIPDVDVHCHHYMKIK